MTLYFAESHTLAEKWRRFDVHVEERLSFTSVDIVEASGGPQKAMAMTTMAFVRDGELSIGFDAINRDPYVSAIEVKGVSDAGASAPSDSPVGKLTMIVI